MECARTSGIGLYFCNRVALVQVFMLAARVTDGKTLCVSPTGSTHLNIAIKVAPTLFDCVCLIATASEPCPNEQASII